MLISIVFRHLLFYFYLFFAQLFINLLVCIISVAPVIEDSVIQFPVQGDRRVIDIRSSRRTIPLQRFNEIKVS